MMRTPLLSALGCCAALVFICAAQPRALYQNDFEQAVPGKPPADMLVLDGAFEVKQEGTNKFIELPGAPLDAFSVLFGPGEKENVAVSARVYGTAKGRRSPAFGVGLNGAAGYRLQVSPGRRSLELLKGDSLLAGVPYNWRSGSWTRLCLRLRKVGEGEWKLEGKAWPQGESEPGEWMIAYTEKEQPRPGRAVILGSPFSGTPIRYDDLLVVRAEGP